MYITGKNTILYFLKDGDYQPFLCATDCSLTINTETKDVRTINDGIWAKKRGQRMSFSVSLTGLIELQEISPVTFWVIQNYQMQMLPIDFRMVFTDPATALVKYVTGSGLIVTSTLTGVPVGFATSQFEIEGDGAPVITDSATVCEAFIGSISVDAGVGYVDIDYTGVAAYVERMDYTINGGGRESIFLTGTSGTIPLGDLAPGVYTVVVYPICPNNGLDGESQSITFTVEEDGEVTECAAPVAIYTVILEPEYAQVQWDYFGDPPAGGFLWQQIDMTIGSEVAAGIAMSNGVDLTLVPGHEYQFRVKTLCESGVSESGFYIDYFTAPSNECNTPASVSPDIIGEDTATIEWTAASPVPPGGYGWELLLSGTPVDSGTTSGTSVNLTDLTPGTSYSFRVRSLCAGGATSTWATTTFDTAGDPPVYSLNWGITESTGTAEVTLNYNGAPYVVTTVSDSGVISPITGGDTVGVTTVGTDGNTFTVELYNDTVGGSVFSQTSSFPVTMPNQELAPNNNYTLTVIISPP